jgi:hypothetical protein
MIKIYYQENPAGNLWLEYDKEGGLLCDHIIGDGNWSPGLDYVMGFIYLCRLHWITVDISEEAMKYLEENA